MKIQSPIVPLYQPRPRLPDITRPGHIRAQPKTTLDPFDMYIRRQERLARYEEQTTMYNLLDPILNTAARNKLSSGTWYENIPVLGEYINTLHGYFDILSRMFDIRDPATMLMTTLRFFGDTFDLASSLTIKPFLHSAQYGTTLGESYARLTGAGRHDGRYNYWFGDYNESIDWLPENWAVNIIGEILIDPSIWVTIGLSAIPNMAGASKKQIAKIVTEGLDTMTVSQSRKISRSLVSVFDTPADNVAYIARANRQLWRGDPKGFQEAMIAYRRQTGILKTELTDHAISELYTRGMVELGAKRFYKLLVGFDNAERAIMKILKQVSPIRATKKSLEFGWNKLKHRDVNEAMSELTAYIEKLDRRYTIEDTRNLNIEDLQALYETNIAVMKKAKAERNTKAFNEALENEQRLQEMISLKHTHMERELQQEIINVAEKERIRRKAKVNLAKKEMDNIQLEADPKIAALRKKQKGLIRKRKREAIAEETATSRRITEIDKEIAKLSPQTIGGKRTEYGKAVRRYKYQRSVLDTQTEFLRSAKEDLNTRRNLNKNLNILKTFAEEKDNSYLVRTEKEFTQRYKQLSEIEELIRVEKQRSAINTTKLVTLYKQKNEILHAIKAYRSTREILNYLMQSDSTSNYLVNLLSSTNYINVRKLLLRLSTDHFKAYETIVKENKKIIEEGLLRFSHNSIDLSEFMRLASTHPQQFKALVDGGIVDKKVQEAFVESLEQLAIRDRMTKLDRTIEDLVSKEDEALSIILQRGINKIDTPKDDGLLGNFIGEITKSLLNIIEAGKKGIRTIREEEILITEINRTLEKVTGVLGDTAEVARIYKALNILNKPFFKTGKKINDKQVSSMASEWFKDTANMRKLIRNVHSSLGGRKKSKETLDKLIKELKSFKESLLASETKQQRALVMKQLDKGGEFYELRNIINQTYIENSSSPYERIGSWIFDENYSKLKTLSTNHDFDRRLDMITNFVEYVRKENYSANEMVVLDYMMHLFSRTNMVKFTDKGVPQIGDRLQALASTEYKNLVMDTYKGMIRMKNFYNEIDNIYRLPTEGTQGLVYYKHPIKVKQTIDEQMKADQETLTALENYISKGRRRERAVEIIQYTSTGKRKKVTPKRGINATHTMQEKATELRNKLSNRANYKEQQVYSHYVSKNTLIRNKLYANTLSQIDEDIANNLFSQHLFAIEALSRYKVKPDLLHSKTVDKTKAMINNFNRAIIKDPLFEASAKKGKAHFPNFTETDMINFYDNLIESVQNTIQNMFADNVDISRVKRTAAKFIQQHNKQVKYLQKKEKYGFLSKADRKQYDKLKNEILELIKNHKDIEKYSGIKHSDRVMNNLYDVMTGATTTTLSDKHVNLIHALLYRQEYGPIYHVMSNLHASNFLLGDDLKIVIRMITDIIESTSNVATTAAGEMVRLPQNVTNYLRHAYPKLLDAPLKDQLDFYVERQYINMMRILENLRQKNIVNMDHLKSNNNKKVENIFNLMMNSVEGSTAPDGKPIGAHYIFHNRFYMKTDEHAGHTTVYNMMGERYAGDIDFKNANFLFVDTETTSIKKIDKEVWQVGMVKVDADGNSTPYNIYLPVKKGDIPGAIKKLTGHKGSAYKNNLAKQSTTDLKELQRLNADLIDDNTVIIAHNAMFDIDGFSQVFGEGIAKNNPVIDTLPLFRLHVAEQKNRLNAEIDKLSKIKDDKSILERKSQLQKEIDNLEEKLAELKTRISQQNYKKSIKTWTVYNEDIFNPKRLERRRFTGEVELRNEDLEEMFRLARKKLEYETELSQLPQPPDFKEIEQKLAELQKRLRHYEDFEKYKQEYLVDKVVSKERKEQIIAELQEKTPDSIIQDHNAVYDAAMLEELLNNFSEVDKTPHRMLPQLLENYGIDRVADLNDRTIGVLSLEDKGVLKTNLENVTAKVDQYRRKLSKIAESTDDKEVVHALARISRNLREYNLELTGSAKDINVNEIYKGLQDTLEYVYDIEHILKSSKPKTVVEYIVDEVTPFSRSYADLGGEGKLGTPIEHNIAFSHIDGIPDLEKIVEEVYDIDKLLQEIYNRDDEILTAFFGDTRAQVVTNKLMNNFRFLSEYSSSNNLRTLRNIFRGDTEALLESNDKTVAEYYKSLLKEHATATGHDVDKLSHRELLSIYRKDNDNEITKFLDFIDDVDDYVDFNRRIYNDMFNRLKQVKNEDNRETVRIGFAKINEFMNKLERKYKHMVDQAVLDGREVTKREFHEAYNRILSDREMSPLLESNMLRKSFAEYVGMSDLEGYHGLNITAEIEKFVKRRIDKYLEQGNNKLRLFLNIDTETSNEFYYLFKQNLLDPLYQMSKIETKSADTATVITRVSPEFERIKKIVDAGLEEIRAPLRYVKYENLAAPTYHLGALHKHIEELKKGFFYSNLRTTAELVLRNEAQVVRLSKASRDITKAHRQVWDALDGLTDLPESMNTFVTSQKSNDFATLLQNLVHRLTDNKDATIDVFSSYFRHNQKLTQQRIIKTELLDSVLGFAENDSNIKAYKNALNAIEEWAVESGYLKKIAGGEVDLDAATELMYRIKASVWDFIEDVEPLNYKKSIENLYSQNFTKSELFQAKQIKMEQMKDVARATEYSYKHMRDIFGEGPEGAKRMYDFIRRNREEYNVIRFDFDSKTKTGVGLKKLKIESAQDIIDLDTHAGNNALLASSLGIVDQNTYYRLQREVGQVFKFKRNGVPDKIRRHYLMPLKSMMLFNANFVFSNIFDAVLKNMIANEGGLLGAGNIVKNTYRAQRMHKDYMDLFQEAHDFGIPLKTFKSKKRSWVELYEEFLAKENKLDANTKARLTSAKFIHDFLPEPGASGNFHEMLMSLEGSAIGKGHRSTEMERVMNTIFYGKGPLSWNMSLNSRVEIYSRLALYLTDVERGLTRSEALTKVLKTHYNYMDKSREEMLAEFAIPFMSFPIRSFLFWADAFYANPDQTKTLSKLIYRSWGQDAVAENDYARYQAARGRVPIGDYSVNLGLTWMDAMSAMGGRENVPVPFADQSWRKLNPVAKNLMDTERPIGERFSRMPGASQITAFGQATTAFTEGSTDLSRYAPSMFNPYYRRGGNTFHRTITARHPQFSKPYSYNTGNLAPKASRSINYRMTNLDRYRKPGT